MRTFFPARLRTLWGAAAAVVVSLALPGCLQYQTDTANVRAVPGSGGSRVSVDLHLLRIATLGPCSYTPYYRRDFFLQMPWGAAEIPGRSVWVGTGPVKDAAAAGRADSGETGQISISADGRWLAVNLGRSSVNRSYRIRRGPGVPEVKGKPQR